MELVKTKLFAEGLKCDFINQLEAMGLRVNSLNKLICRKGNDSKVYACVNEESSILLLPFDFGMNSKHRLRYKELEYDEFLDYIRNNKSSIDDGTKGIVKPSDLQTCISPESMPVLEERYRATLDSNK
ncbi:hypothetical protein AUW17_05310 [Tenacibaculum dicentrarchi]|nr:hypothetical protein AUW17_03170 [Tenacibaculum dicentrarchi]ALU74721.1 hypothetical protein AUW17_05310 [Tenacibaculum dicentrarchi]